MLIAVKTDSKFTLHHMGKSLSFNLWEIEFKIWKVTILILFLPQRNYGMDFLFSGNNGNIECAVHLRCPVAYLRKWATMRSNMLKLAGGSLCTRVWISWSRNVLASCSAKQIYHDSPLLLGQTGMGKQYSFRSSNWTVSTPFQIPSFGMHYCGKTIWTIIIGYWIYIVQYSAQAHMAKDAQACECVSAIWKIAENFNNLFIIYP